MIPVLIMARQEKKHRIENVYICHWKSAGGNPYLGGCVVWVPLFFEIFSSIYILYMYVTAAIWSCCMYQLQIGRFNRRSSASYY